MALPQLTDEQRAAALEKAAAARRIRAELKDRLKRGGTNLKQVLKDAETDEWLKQGRSALTAADRTNRMATQLLAMAHVDAAELSAPQEWVNVGAKLRAICNELIDKFIADGRCDAAQMYTRHIPVRVIAHMLGVPESDGDQFIQWIHEILELGITDEALVTKTALRLLADIPGLQIKDARQTLTIGTADITVAETLGLALNAPVAKVDLCVVDDNGTVVLAGYGVYRGDVVRIDTKLI